MATKPTLPTLVNTGNVQAQLTTINNGYRQIENEFEKMLSREDNSLPNHMLDALDMDGNKVINVEDGTEGADAVNKSQLDTKENSLGNPTEDGMFLASLTTGYRYWAKGASGGTAAVPTNEFEYIDFDITPAVGPVEGRLLWNDTDGTLDLGVKGGNVTLQIGQEQLIRVVNKTGTNLLEANYQCVKISGAQGQRPKVGLALGDNDLNSADTIGLVTESILNNQEGFVTTSGIVRNINTTGSLQGETWNDGDVLYLSGTTAGRLTNIKPSAPTHTVIAGFVVYAHANNGKIYVKVDNGYELDELHNVNITSVANNNVLRYNSTFSVWENIPQTSLDAGTVTNGVYTTGDQTIAGVKTFSGTSTIVNGNVGIGTASPINKLTISGSSFASGELGTFAITGNTTAKRLAMGVDSTSTMYGWIQSVESGVGFRGLSLQPLGGSVGIGTTAPGFKLDVSSTGNEVARFTGASNGYTDFTNGTGTLRVQMLSNVPHIGSFTNHNLNIITNNTVRATFDTSGNLSVTGNATIGSGSTVGGIAIGYRDVPVTISNANTTFALADAGKAFGKDNTTAYTYTIPANGTVAFPIGTVITVFNNNATSNITVAITTDTLRLAGTTTTGSRTVAPFALCTLFKVSSTVWMASGAGVT